MKATRKNLPILNLTASIELQFPWIDHYETLQIISLRKLHGIMVGFYSYNDSSSIDDGRYNSCLASTDACLLP